MHIVAEFLKHKIIFNIIIEIRFHKYSIMFHRMQKQVFKNFGEVIEVTELRNYENIYGEIPFFFLLTKRTNEFYGRQLIYKRKIC